MADKIKIAIVDDNALVRESFVKLFKDYGNVEVILQAANGLDLLNQFVTIKPNVIILDIDMPIMNGRDTLIKIKNEHSFLKVIMISNHFTPPYINTFLNLGADSFLPKNCDIDDLLETINQVKDKGRFYNKAMCKIMPSYSYK